MTPIQGDWTISSIGLPPAVLRKIYFDNARKLLARSLPLPRLRARHISQDLELNGRLEHPLWRTAQPVWLEQSAHSGAVRPELSTAVRALWSEKHLYLAYRCPFTKLTVFTPPQFDQKRCGSGQDGANLWDRDVVEAFIATNPEMPERYAEFEVAPTNERLDLLVLGRGRREVTWTSQFQSAVNVDHKAKVWVCELRIPLAALSSTKPERGTLWRLNLFRCDRANRAGLAWSPTLSGTFHVPERFGALECAE